MAVQALATLSNGMDLGTAASEAGSSAAERWDRFVEATPGGDLLQTTAWAYAKRALGFEVCQVISGRGDEIVGGGQIVMKRFGPLGALGYVARGPLVGEACPEQAALVLDDIERAARARRVRHLIVQPPEGGDHIAALLAARAYVPDAPEVAPTATVRIDLSPSLDRILARLSVSKRQQIRRGQREGVETRIGGPDDLDLFHSLHTGTARRQGFGGRSRSYLQHHWDALHARGFVHLIFAHHEGRTLAGIWLTSFGDTMTYRLPGWAGEGRNLYPNVACFWRAIRWAKERGYRYFDFGGFDRRYAELLATGQPLPEEFDRTPDTLKRGFGPEVVLLPRASQHTFNPVARSLVRSLYPRLARSEPLRLLAHRFRNG